MMNAVFGWYTIATHFDLRGGEVSVQIRKQDLVFEKDADGEEYMKLDKDFVIKNTPRRVDRQGVYNMWLSSRQSSSCHAEETSISLGSFR